MPSISVIIITLNAAKYIRTCLESVQFADEIIVVDSGSTDSTRTICQEYTEHVVTADWPGFGPQKNRALELAHCDWVFSIDADERVSSELQTAIKAIVAKNQSCAYRITRKLVFNNKVIRYACGSDAPLRLFKRGHGRFSNDTVHEDVLTQDSIQSLSAPLYHHSFEDVHDLINRLNDYTSLSAIKKQKQGQQGSVIKAMLKGLWMFFRVYFLQKGFLDGKEGLVLAISFAEGSYYRYIKLLFDAPYSQHSQDGES